MSDDERGWHHVIVPDEIIRLMATPKDQVVAVAILCWLESRIRSRVDLLAGGLEIGVSPCGYDGGYYPAIGVRLTDYTFEASEEAVKYLTDVCSDLLNSSTVAEFAAFAVTSGIDWVSRNQELQVANQVK